MKNRQVQPHVRAESIADQEADRLEDEDRRQIRADDDMRFHFGCGPLPREPFCYFTAWIKAYEEVLQEFACPTEV